MSIMKNPLKLTEIIVNLSNGDKQLNNFYQEQLVRTKDHFKQLIFSKSKNPIIYLSHLADSDGFNFQATQELATNVMLKAIGNKREVVSERFMNFSNDPKSDSNIANIINSFGRGDYVIGDMPTLNPSLVDMKLVDSMCIIDHHPTRYEFPKNMLVCNPWLSGINGSKEFSAAMLGGVLSAMLYEDIIQDSRLDKKQVNDLKKVRDVINKVVVCGVAGSQADMQEATGGNAIAYQYLQEEEHRTRFTKKNVKNTLIRKVKTPFFGYATKHIPKIIAQTSPNFHFNDRVATRRELEGFLRETYKTSFNKTRNAIEDIITEFDVAFVRTREDKNVLINTAYLNSIEDEKVEKLNKIFRKHFDSDCVKKGPTENGEAYIPERNLSVSLFKYEDHDIIASDEKLLLAKALCCEWGMPDSKQTLFNLHPSQVAEINHIYRRNVLAFSDPDPKERAWAQKELSKPQYLINLELGFGPENLTIEELANFTTAMSKQRVGDKLIELMHLLDISKGKESNRAKELKDFLDKTLKVYQTNIFTLMSEYEKTYTNRDAMTSLQKNLFYSNVDHLEPHIVGDLTLPSINGVVAGLVCNTGNMPEKKAILYTGCTVKDNGKEYLKISGRATSGPFSYGIHINTFMERWGGGGHSSAAACTIPKTKLDDFLQDLSNYDLFGG